MEIQVYIDSSAFAKHTPKFCHRVDFLDSVAIDFNCLIKSMKILYGPQCIVSFICS